jgi:hypothetical protein
LRTINLYRLIFPLSTRLLLIPPSTLILPPSLYLLLFLVQNLSSLLCPSISHPSFFFYLRQHHMHSSVFPHISLPPLFTRYLLLLYTTRQYNISPLTHTHTTHNLSYLPHIIFSVFTHYLTPSASAMPSQCECDTAPASQCQCDATPVPPCECDANTT